MTLPYDVARCEGCIAGRVLTTQPFTVEYSFRRGASVACVNCLRRTSPGRTDGTQTMMTPPPFVDGHCPDRIAPPPDTPQPSP